MNKPRLSLTVVAAVSMLLFLNGSSAEFYRPTRSATLTSTSTPPDLAWELPWNGRGGGGSSNRKVVSNAGSSNNNDEGATISNEVFNLVKSIVGAGVLGLPAGIASFGNAPSALVPAMALIVIISLLSSYGFSLIGRICAYTGATSYREAWTKSVGKEGSWLPALCCLLVTTCSVLAYSMILSDTIPQLALAVLGITMTRAQALVGVTAVVLLPLCLLKELKSLAPFSLVGISGMLYTVVAMTIRYLQGAYKLASASSLVESVPTQFQPSFGTQGASAVWSPATFLLISMLSTASMSHYLAPKFYTSLRNPTVKRYQTVVSISFGISTLVFVSVAAIGFLTFGATSSGLILNNYSPYDSLMSASRMAVATSLLTSYPLAFSGVRQGFNDLCQLSSIRRNEIFGRQTILLLAGVTFLAFHIQDLRLVLAFGGATWGNALIYLFPTFMFVKYCAQKDVPNALKSELPLVWATGIVGLGMGIIGTLQAIKSA